MAQVRHERRQHWSADWKSVEDVRFRLVLVEHLDDVAMQLLFGDVTWEALHVVTRVAVGAEVEEDARAVGTAFLRGDEQWRLVVDVLSVAVGSTHEENTHCLAIVDRHCPVQRRLACKQTR